MDYAVAFYVTLVALIASLATHICVFVEWRRSTRGSLNVTESHTQAHKDEVRTSVLFLCIASV
jgi:hypothetical protein